MKERMRILIGHDGSPCADAALDDLQRAGLPREAESLILSVSERWLPIFPLQVSVGSASIPLSPNAVTSSSLPAAGSAAAVMVGEVDPLALAAKVHLQSRFPAWVINGEGSSGSPAREILKKAEEFKPHLIVVGCQGRSAVGGFLLGSVSQKVVNEAHCSVRVCRGSAWKDGSPVRIVIGLDGNLGSEQAVSAVASRVWPTSSAVRLITAIDPVGASSQKKSLATSKGMKRDAVEKFMKVASDRLRRRSLSVSTRIEEGDPKKILIVDAEEWGADCIFLGASAATNVLERFLLGSVATAIVARAHCSVEVVRSGY